MNAHRRRILHTTALLIWSLLSFREAQTLTFHEVPQPTGVLLGNSAQLNCTLQCESGVDACNGLIWTEKVSSATGVETDIYYSDGNVFNNNNPNRNRYSLVSGTTNLLIRNANTDDAGRYTCRPNRGAGSADPKFAYLAVFEKSTCHSNGIAVAGDRASVMCTVKYHKTNDPEDNKTPSLSWNITEETEVRGNSEVTMTANFTVTSEDNGRSYTCRAFYSPTPPYYTDTCNTSIVVRSSVSNVRLNVTSVNEGGNATFHCTADGDTPITYTWQKVAGSLPGGDRWQGGRDGSVTLSNVQRSDDGSYTCTADNDANRPVTSDQVYFDVYFHPGGVRIIQKPGGAVDINSNITLRCSTTTSSKPPVTLEWLIDNNNPLGNVSTSQTNGDHNGEVSLSEMKMKASRQRNGAVVTCRVKSLPILIDSHTIKTLFPPTGVTTTESPPGAVRMGSSKQLSCTTDSANPSAVITWMRNDTTTSDPVQLTNPDGDYKAKKTNSTITIATTRNHNNNQYRCVVKHQNMKITALNRIFKLNVTYPHTVTVQIENTTVMEGGHVTLTCEAAGGNPQNVLSYEWHRTSDFTSDGGRLASVKQFELFNVSYKDAGKYECHVTNAGGTSSEQKNLTVLYKAKQDPRFENHESVKHSEYGENVTFILKVISYPLPEFNWTYGTQHKHQSSYHKVSVKNQDLQSELTVYNVMKEDFTTYTCVVMNYVGSSVFNFTLKPAAAPDTPASFQLVYTSVTTVTLSWISLFNGGYPQTFHFMYRKNDELWPMKPQIQSIADPGEGSEVTYKLHGLHPGISYEFRVKAVNSRPTGPNSSDFTSAVKTTTKEKPSVTFSVIRESGSNTAKASWSVNRGRFTHFVIKICETVCRYHNLTAKEAINDNTVITGLEPDKTYTYKLMLYDNGDLIHETRDVNSEVPENPVDIITPVVSVTLIVLVAVTLVVAILIYRRRRGGRDKRGLMNDKEEGGYHNNDFNNEMNDLNDLNQNSAIPVDTEIDNSKKTRKAKSGLPLANPQLAFPEAENMINIEEDKDERTERNATLEQESVLYAEVGKKNKKKAKQATQAALYAEIDKSKKKNKKEKQETQDALNADVDKSKKKNKKEKQEPVGAMYADIDKSKKKNKQEKLGNENAVNAEMERKMNTNTLLTQSEPQGTLYAEIDTSAKRNNQENPELSGNSAVGVEANENAYHNRSEVRPGAGVNPQLNAEGNPPDENTYQNFEELQTGKKETIQMHDKIVGADGTLYEDPRNFDFEGSAKPSQKPKPKLKPRPNPKPASNVDEATEYACIDFTRKV